MTNGEKFKTAQERAEAFCKFCYKQTTEDNGCGNCPLDKYPSCAFAWLELEAEEEKMETIEDIVDEMRQHTRVSAADAFYGVTEWVKLCDRIIAAHNRVAKAVKESEAKK